MQRLPEIDKTTELQRSLAIHMAPFMFAAALAFLVCQAILVVMWVDVPNLSADVSAARGQQAGSDPSLRYAFESGSMGDRLIFVTFVVMGAVWALVIAESIFHWGTRPWRAEMRRYHFFGFLFCVCPSLRMCARSPELNARLWLPRLGWRQPNKRLRRRLKRHFSVPMIVIALLIMPVLIVEYFFKAQVAASTPLQLMLHFGTGVIWFAFAFEFILMVSVADKKLQYCKQHWIDLAIILLPLISFLRSLRVLRATRISSALRIPMLTKLARVYRLRGTSIKALRALMVLGLFQRTSGSGLEKRIAKLHRQLNDLELEAKEIRRAITKLEKLRSENEDDSPDAALIESVPQRPK